MGPNVELKDQGEGPEGCYAGCYGGGLRKQPRARPEDGPAEDEAKSNGS